MTETWAIAALWLGLALLAALISIWFRTATALSEIVVGTLAQWVVGVTLGASLLPADTPWITFLASTGAIMLTFLAGAELDPAVLRVKWKEATAVGLMSFFVPFIGCAVVAYTMLDWSIPASWLAGVALSTTSVAVVYAMMLEFGLNTTDYGKMWLIPRFFKRYGSRPSELEAKFLLLCLFGLGALATWADSEAMLPAYLLGMVLAGSVGKDHALIRRLRTLTLGLLTPFYFIRAGSLVSVR